MIHTMALFRQDLRANSKHLYSLMSGNRKQRELTPLCYSLQIFMFYCNLEYFDYKQLDRNFYDLSQNYMFLSLLPIELKKKFLSYVNQDAYDAYKYILNINDTFVNNINESKFNILGPFSYYSKIEDELTRYKNNFYLDNGSKIIFFYSSDDDRSINFKDKFGLDNNQFAFFRVGGFKSKKNNNVFGMPYIVKDHFRDNYMNKKLSLSYCGWPDNNPFKYEVVKNLYKLDYADFIIRDCWADDKKDLSPDDSYNIGPTKQSKQEFISNIENNLYGLAVRGATNSSYRLYELFMMGRIPVLLNTDCILPFENKIPYRQNTVYIDNFSNIDEQIKKFHNQHTEQELINIQKQNRQIWLDYFRVDSAYKQTKEFLISCSN